MNSHAYPLFFHYIVFALRGQSFHYHHQFKMDMLDKAKTFLAEKVGNVPKPEADITDVDLKGITHECITYQAAVAVKNPYGVSIPICEISYLLKCATRNIASGTIPDPGSLKGSDTTNVLVPVKVPHSVLISLMKDIGADWDIDYELELGFIVDLPVIGNFTIPLSSKGEIKLPTFSDLWGGGNKEKDIPEKENEMVV